jgi:predicted HicB family RNase H-like nuclease
MCEDQGVPRPATGQTPLRNIRVANELWAAAQAKAKAEGRTLTEVIVTYLRRYVSAPPRKRADDE